MTDPRLPGVWIDVTLPIGRATLAWTGLEPVALTLEARIADGEPVNAGRLACSLHSGTHADAPYHVGDSGARAEALEVGLYVGSCQVIRLAGGQAIDQRALESAGVEPGAPARLLIATGAPYDGVNFPAIIPTLDPGALEWLLGLGVRLVGVDVPSIDPLQSATLEAHHLLFAAGGGVLENLDLHGVLPGLYELCAPPLKIIGGDAAPVRALLRPV